MKRKIFTFVLFFAFIPLMTFAADREKSDQDKNFFSLDRLKKDFRLNLTGNSTSPAAFLNEANLAVVAKEIARDTFCSSFTGEDKKGRGKAKVKKVKTKRFKRAVLTNACVWLTDSIRYWSMSALWIEDWQYELTWKDQKRRFTTLEANIFDSNPYITNWAHGLSGAVFYNMARYHRLNILESVIFEMISSLWWEYITEWREVVSVNDNFFSGLGGLPVGESLSRLAGYLNRKPGTFNKVLSYIVNPVMGLNDLLGEKKWRKRFPAPDVSESKLDLYFGQKQSSYKGGKGWSSPDLYLCVDTSLNTIPGYGDPAAGDISRFVRKPLINEFFLDFTIGKTYYEEFNYFSKIVLFGLFRQKLRQDAAKRLHGYNFFLAAGSAFDLFRKKGNVYYDQGEYHYDFTAGEQATQPTEFTDKLAVVNLFGPTFNFSLYSGRFKLWLTLDAYFDFAMVNSMAVNEYSKKYDLYEPRLKTTLAHYGYHYAFGFTLSSKGGMRYRNIELDGRVKYQYYDSVEGLDRFQYNVVDDSNLTDYRFMYKVSAGYALPGTPVKVVFAWEGIDREGTLKDITHRERETRIYTQLKFSY